MIDLSPPLSPFPFPLLNEPHLSPPLVSSQIPQTASSQHDNHPDGTELDSESTQNHHGDKTEAKSLPKPKKTPSSQTLKTAPAAAASTPGKRKADAKVGKPPKVRKVDTPTPNISPSTAQFASLLGSMDFQSSSPSSSSPKGWKVRACKAIYSLRKSERITPAQYHTLNQLLLRNDEGLETMCETYLEDMLLEEAFSAV